MRTGPIDTSALSDNKPVLFQQIIGGNKRLLVF